MNRNAVISIRPVLNLDSSENFEIEKFQNETLRPILKFQNDLIIQIAFHKFPALNHMVIHKERTSYLIKSLNNQPMLSQFFIGLVVALFSSEELSFYFSQSVEINRRIKTMMIERIASHQPNKE